MTPSSSRLTRMSEDGCYYTACSDNTSTLVFCFISFCFLTGGGGGHAATPAHSLRVKPTHGNEQQQQQRIYSLNCEES